MRFACPGLFSWAEKKATIVTPSTLLASVAAQQVASDHLRLGRETWQRTSIYSMDAWLAACWHQARYAAADIPSLLSPAQELTLWQEIIEREHPYLFDPGAAARLARRAVRLIVEWHIAEDTDLWNEHQEGQQFRAWLTLFRRKCREHRWITRADLWHLVPKWIENGICSREPAFFAAFETTTPALERIKHALGAAAITEPACTRQPAELFPVKSFPSAAEELEFAARFARARFEADPGRSIVVFVPGLAARRADVQRVFENVFYPSRTLAAAQEHSAFHLTATAPLLEQPIVGNALLLLELARPHIHHADAGAILRCPFMPGASAERSERALADLELRKRRDLQVTLRDLESVTARCPQLQRLCTAVRRVLVKMPQRAELPVWSAFIADVLKAAGWPGDAPLTRIEEQALEQWNEVLSSLASLGLVANRLTYDAALTHLRRLLSAPGPEQGDWSSPVQILEATEASGLAFDSAVVTGLSDETWPPPIDISPLVPWRLQRAHDVPGSTAQSIYAVRDRLTHALFQSAPAIVATYSGRLSPAAARFTRAAETEVPVWRGKLRRQSFAPAALDEREDRNAPPYAAQQPTRGGTGLVRSQSLCPFRAFAEYRLHAETPEDACFGFDARDRGGFVHAALQLVWRELKSQDQLRRTPEQQLRTIVHDAVLQAVADDESSPLHHLASSAERERLEQLILDWLRIERARKQRFTVETVEEERYYEVPGLRLRLRVDRIDRLPNGRVLLIDYKSGKQSREKLKCPRPSEPQLLVYAAASEDNVDGIFFGELKPRELRAVGFSREKHFDSSSITVLKDGWDAFLHKADLEVERIANQFVSGYAAVEPLRGACQYCRVKPLCRVNESVAGEEETD
jgi:ATP-dependent helicase/nuclease subunit B